MSSQSLKYPKKLRRNAILGKIFDQTGSIIKKSVKKLLKEPNLEPTPKFSQRMEEKRRRHIKKAATKVKNSSRRNLMEMPRSKSLPFLNKNGSQSLSSLSTLTSNGTNTDLNKEQKLLESVSLSELNIPIGNITHLYPKHTLKINRIPNPMKNFEQPNRRPNLSNNYIPNSTRISKKHRNLLNVQRRNRNYNPPNNV